MLGVKAVITIRTSIIIQAEKGHLLLLCCCLNDLYHDSLGLTIAVRVRVKDTVTITVAGERYSWDSYLVSTVVNGTGHDYSTGHDYGGSWQGLG